MIKNNDNKHISTAEKNYIRGSNARLKGIQRNPIKGVRLLDNHQLLTTPLYMRMSSNKKAKANTQICNARSFGQDETTASK